MSIYLNEQLIAGSIPAPAAMNYKGSCLQADLPTTGQSNGDYGRLSDTTGEYSGQCAIGDGTNNKGDYSSSNITVDTSLSTTSTNPVENKVITASLQAFYDGIFPVNGTVFGFQAPGVPSGITATGVDVSSSYDGRYFKISSTSAVGTSEAESLPLPSVSITSAGDHNHDRGTMNITGLLRTAPSADTNVGDTMPIKHASGAFYNAGNAGDGAQRLYDINATYHRDANPQTIGFNAANNGSGVTSTGGSHTHTASISGTPYSSGVAVKPLTTTIKIGKRTA